jgi:hypothetical protein
MIVLDTNVLSELMRSAPSDAVLAWVARQPATLLFTTTITQAEVLFGIALLAEGRRRSGLEQAARQMFKEDFADRVLPFDAAAAGSFAELAASRRRRGKPISTLDAQIAAIVVSRGAVLASRNVSDFLGCGLTIANPWAPDA